MYHHIASAVDADIDRIREQQTYFSDNQPHRRILYISAQSITPCGHDPLARSLPTPLLGLSARLNDQSLFLYIHLPLPLAIDSDILGKIQCDTYIDILNVITSEIH